jgi:ribonuclease HI
MIQSPPMLLDSNALVCELIDRDTKWWNLPMLKNLFAEEEVNLILSLPISVSNQGDKQIWRGTKNGFFSVKSAYFIQKELERKEEAESSARRGISRVWQEIWKLRLPNAGKIFLWRACHEILPTWVNLYRRKIVEDALCPLCGREEETVLHVLWQCPSTADMWSVGCRKLQKWSSNGRDFLHLVEKAFNKCEPEEIQLFAKTARRVCLRRNDFVVGNFFQHPNVLVETAKEYVAEFMTTTKRRNIFLPNNVEPTREKKWKSPEAGWLKVNRDASFSKNQGWMGFGAVVRDETGMVLAAQCKSFVGFLDPTVAEARAALMAIQFCRERGFMRVHFEGDTQKVVNAVNSTSEDWSNVGLLVEDIRRDLQVFQQWRMSYICREGNCAAHSLSKFATINLVDMHWLFEPPDCIKDIIRMEQITPSGGGS